MKPIPWQALALAAHRVRNLHDPDALAQLDAFVADLPRPRSYVRDDGFAERMAAFKARHPSQSSPMPITEAPPLPPVVREPGDDDAEA